MISLRTSNAAVLALVALTLVSCNKDKPNDTAAGDGTTLAASAETWKNRRLLADSVIKSAPKMPEVVKELGAARYDEAEPNLAAIVVKEAEKTRDCYINAAKNIDPNLTIVMYMLVNFGGAGWDLVRVEKWTQSSEAGGAVVSCLNSKAKGAWTLPTKGVKMGAHLVKLVYTPDSVQKASR